MDGRGVPENQKVKLHQEIRRNLEERFSFFGFAFFSSICVSLSLKHVQYLKKILFLFS